MSFTKIAALAHENPRREVARFIKFATVGAIGMVIDLSLLNLMYKVVLPPLFTAMAAAAQLALANAVSFSAAVISNFTWNRLWTFPESRQRPLFRQLAQFALVNLIGLGINEVVLLTIYHIIGGYVPDPLNYNLAKVLAIGVVLFWNFGVNRLWTYRNL
jgi:putative flippase GtrA